MASWLDNHRGGTEGEGGLANLRTLAVLHSMELAICRLLRSGNSCRHQTLFGLL